MATIELYLCGNDDCERHKSNVLKECDIDEIKHASYGSGVRQFRHCTSCGGFKSELYRIDEALIKDEFLQQEKENQDKGNQSAYIVSGVGEIHSRLSGDFRNLMQKIAKGTPNHNMRNF